MAQHQGVVSPSLLSLTISGEVLVACLVGGLRVFGGPLLGAVVLIMSQELLSGMTTESDLFVGVLLLAIVLVLPSGLSSLPGKLTGLRRGRSGPDPAPPPDGADASAAAREPEAVNR